MAVVSEIVSTTDNLKSLAEALRVTDLNETLSGELYVEEARVVQADIEADNGIIHVIDVVILPLAEEMLDSMDAGPIAS